MKRIGGYAGLVALVALTGSGCQSCLDVQPEAYPCVWDSGSSIDQCPEGWRCGLIGRCHPTGLDAGAPYACLSDSDCEAGWRCDATGFCTNPTNELLSSTQYEGALLEEQLNPLLLSGPPLLFTAASTGTPVLTSTAYVTLLDGGIVDEVQILVSDSGVSTRAESTWPAGDALALATIYFTTRNQTYALLDGGVASNIWGSSRWFLPIPGAIGLRRADVAGDNVAVLIADAGFLALDMTPTAQWLQLDGGCAQDPVWDLQMVTAHSTPLTTDSACLLAVSPSGVFYANYAAYSGFVAPPDAGFNGFNGPSTPWWSPLPADSGVPGAGCGNPPGQTQVTGLFPSNRGIGMALATPSGPEAALLEYDGMTQDAGIWFGCTPDQPCCGRLGAFAIPPCAVCGGLQLAEVRPVEELITPAFDVRCVDGTGQSYWFLVSSPAPGASCNPPFPLFVASLFVDQVAYNAASPQNVAEYAGAHGQIWTGFAPRQDQAPFLLDVSPAFVLEPDGGLYVGSFSNQFNALGVDTGLQDAWLFTPGTGLTSNGIRFDPNEHASAIQGQAGWVLEENLQVHDLTSQSGNDVVALLRGSFTPTFPYRGSVLTTPDGGSELVVSSFDTLYSADVTARVQNPQFPAPAFLEIRAVPLAGNALNAGIFLPPDAGDTLFVHGYVLTQSQLFDVSADSELVWNTTQIPVAIPDGRPLGLWRDGQRARLGLDDGRAYSLPSLVPLAPPIPEVPPVVNAYGVLCGTGYALGNQGVYRLRQSMDGGAMGYWDSVPIGAGITFQATGDPQAFSGGSLHTLLSSSHLYVGTQYGGVVRLSPTAGSCP